MTDSFARSWHDNHAHVVNVAYRILGDVGEAEDVAQESFLRLARTPPGTINDERAWLTVTASRLCLDQVRSARARHEQVPGLDKVEAASGVSADPADRVTLDDEVRSALLVMLERLTPAERVAFVLHDVFRIPFDDIAVTLGKPAATCRQLAKRARHKIAIAPSHPIVTVVPPEHLAVTERFITACHNGDLTTLLEVMAPTAWGVADLLGSGMDPILTHGPAKVAASLLRYYGPPVTLVTHPRKAQTLLAFHQRVLYAVVTLTIEANQVGKINVCLDLTTAPTFY